jgi:hypothetical protein
MTVGLRWPVFVEEGGVQLLAVFGAELEDVTDLDGAPDLQGLAGGWRRFTGLHGAQVRPLTSTLMSRSMETCEDGNRPRWRRWSCRARRAAFIGEDPDPGDHCGNLHRARGTGFRAEQSHDSSGVAGSEARRPVRAREFGLVQLVVAAHQDKDRLAVGDVDQRLDLAMGRRRCKAPCSGPRW